MAIGVAAQVKEHCPAGADGFQHLLGSHPFLLDVSGQVDSQVQQGAMLGLQLSHSLRERGERRGG
jgi:hypothetical protein